MRNPASCGGQVMSNLAFVTKTWLENNLVSKYKYWDKRTELGEGYKEDDVFYSYKIFKGETIIFSDRDLATSGGRRLAKSIEKYGLGEVISIGTKNPNTGNNIRTWVWVYNGNQVKEPKDEIAL
jgi:hypothetical protein